MGVEELVQKGGGCVCVCVCVCVCGGGGLRWRRPGDVRVCVCTVFGQLTAAHVYSLSGSLGEERDTERERERERERQKESVVFEMQ